MNQTDLSDREFKLFRDIVYEKGGINLHEGKKELVRARIGKRIRQIGLSSFKDYYEYMVSDDSGHELTQFLDAISTNLTSFFREKKHFDYLESDVLPEIITKEKIDGTNTIKVWSAGCSTGEEPYSLSICLSEFLLKHPEARMWDFKILATDLSTKVLRTAEMGIFHKKRIENIDRAILKKYFQIGQNNWVDHFRIKRQIRSRIEFKRFNLIEAFPEYNKFAVIFCRNVMIYFDKKIQEQLVNKFYNCLIKGGHLFIGHSESLMGIKHEFTYVKPTVYRKL